MTTRRPDSSVPRLGEVIHYAYLWTGERDAGREDSAKDRPCAVAVTALEDNGETIVFVLPITSRRPALASDGMEISPATRERLGLQREPCWVLLTEVNRFVWPGPNLRPVERPVGRFYSYELLPRGQFIRIRDAVLQRARSRRPDMVQRIDN
jgi:hypothetical protein